jgi:hypothetical protein
MDNKLILEKKVLKIVDKSNSIKVKQVNLEDFGFKLKKSEKLYDNKDIKKTKTLIDFGFSS